MSWRYLGVAPGSMLLPAPRVDLRYWSVIACDQFTSQPEFWRQAEEEVGSRPSTLRMILPEAFLREGEAERESRILSIARTMEDYLAAGVFRESFDGMLLTERTTASGSRAGLLLCADLEAYDFKPGSRPLIRATEETVLSRLPPRLGIRERSALELSHVLLLVDDPEDTVIGQACARRDRLRQAYDIDLLMGGGRLRGWELQGGEALREIFGALNRLRDRAGDGGMLFAVGDGNHSLAAAKAHWERLKPGLPPAARESHPARFAMAELVNLHSPALRFEAIHRAVFGVDRTRLLSLLEPLRPHPDAEAPDIVLAAREGDLPLRLSLPEGGSVLGAVQRLLDSPPDGAQFGEVDYVHGEEALRDLVRARGAAGLLLPAFRKGDLFRQVEAQGRLPKKAFSMGSANEKRFYMECRRIR